MKCSEGLSNRVSNIIRRYNRSYEVCCLYGFFFYHILSYSFGSIFCIVYIVVCFVCFCLILYVSVYFCKLCILLLCLCILIATYVLFCVFCFIVLFCVLFVCKCVLYYCHRVTTQLQLTNISYHNSTHS